MSEQQERRQPTPLPPLTPEQDAAWMREFRQAWKAQGGAEWEARVKAWYRDHGMRY